MYKIRITHIPKSYKSCIPAITLKLFPSHDMKSAQTPKQHRSLYSNT